MKKDLNNNDHNGTNDQRRNRDRSPHADLQVGRLMVTPPRPGQLQIYDKRDGTRGGSVIVETDGGKYGIAKEVGQRFPKVGSYRGQAYLCRHRPAVFRFEATDAEGAGKPKVAIRTSSDVVPFPAHALNGAALRDGSPVAFRVRPKRGNGSGRLWVDQILPLDDGHVPLIAHLIVADKLSFVNDADVLDLFIDGADQAARLGALECDAVTSALGRLASDPSTPGYLRGPAKLAFDKLGSSGHRNASLSSDGTRPGSRRPTDPASGRAADGHGQRPRGTSEDIEEADLDLD